MGNKIKISKNKEIEIKILKVKDVLSVGDDLAKIKIGDEMNIPVLIKDNFDTLCKMYSKLYGGKPETYADLSFDVFLDITVSIVEKNINVLKNSLATLKKIPAVLQKLQ